MHMYMYMHMHKSTPFSLHARMWTHLLGNHTGYGWLDHVIPVHPTAMFIKTTGTDPLYTVPTPTKFKIRQGQHTFYLEHTSGRRNGTCIHTCTHILGILHRMSRGPNSKCQLHVHVQCHDQSVESLYSGHLRDSEESPDQGGYVSSFQDNNCLVHFYM